MRSQSKKCRLSSERLGAEVQPTPPLSQTTEITGVSANDAPPVDGLPSTQPLTPSRRKIAATFKFVRHERHWLLDGNVLVQIGQVRFRLHRSTLVKQSKWFRDMIEDPPHASGRYIYVDEGTGATVYVLDSLEVNVNDFVALLDALDNGMYVSFHSLINIIFD